MNELPPQVRAPLANHGSLPGCGHGVWVGETWEMASSVCAGFLIQTQNRTKVLGIAGKKLPGLSAEGQFYVSQFLCTISKLTCMGLSVHLSLVYLETAACCLKAQTFSQSFGRVYESRKRFYE